MQKITEQLVTKQQLEIIMTAWGTCAEVPSKGDRTIVCFPCKELAEIQWTDRKSDYGQRLYRIDFYRQ